MKEPQRRRGIYPGSFNPPTTGHLAVSRAALEQHHLDVVVWSVSTRALGKDAVQHPELADRLHVLERVAAANSWLEVQCTDAQLLADIAVDFDVVIMGADKWNQIQDPSWYGGIAERDAAISTLPTLAIAPRPPFEVPHQHQLALGDDIASVSSTAARAGDLDLMLPEARDFALETGAWIDEVRYVKALDLATPSWRTTLD